MYNRKEALRPIGEHQMDGEALSERSCTRPTTDWVRPMFNNSGSGNPPTPVTVPQGSTTAKRHSKSDLTESLFVKKRPHVVHV